jgi:hypothetical protein
MVSRKGTLACNVKSQIISLAVKSGILAKPYIYYIHVMNKDHETLVAAVILFQNIHKYVEEIQCHQREMLTDRIMQVSKVNPGPISARTMLGQK